jgi:hypothetical protein
MSESCFEARDEAWFKLKLESLPPDEQSAFLNHRHPCQDKNYTGMVLARCCAQALQAEVCADEAVKRVSLCFDKNGFELEVILRDPAQLEKRRSLLKAYRGYQVYWRCEKDE